MRIDRSVEDLAAPGVYENIENVCEKYKDQLWSVNRQVQTIQTSNAVQCTDLEGF